MSKKTMTFVSNVDKSCWHLTKTLKECCLYRFFLYLTSNKTLKTLSHNWSATSSLTVGGASSVSLMANRNKSNDSHVSRSKIFDSCATCCRVRNTRWHKTAWRLMTSTPAFGHNKNFWKLITKNKWITCDAIPNSW